MCPALSDELRRKTVFTLYPDLRFMSGLSLLPILTASVVRRSKAFLCVSLIDILNHVETTVLCACQEEKETV